MWRRTGGWPRKKRKAPKDRNETKVGGVEYQHHELCGQIRISATSWEPVLLGLAQDEKGLCARVRLQAMGSYDAMQR